jgi:23S rRNA (cytidine1920-2'-O)/16S rRNA (cytidine1409-2'-O)-methyltransferase
VALVKPQFETGPGSTKKGIVRDETLQLAACEGIRDFAATLGWTVAGLLPSPITGGDGNREYLLGASLD